MRASDHGLRRAYLVGLLGLLLVACAPSGVARPPLPPPRADVELFARPGCPHCAEAETFLEDLVFERPTLAVEVSNVLADSAARDRLALLGEAAGATQVGTPALYVRGHVLIGWRGEETRRLVERLLDHPADAAVDSAGAVCPVDPDLPACVDAGQGNASGDGTVELPLVGRVRPREIGLPLFTIVIGIVDGFNPCAMWVLLFLLGLLANLKSRRKMLAIAGTFVLVSGLAYFAFMAAWLHVHRWIGVFRTVQVGLGLLAILVGALNLKDAFLFGRGPSIGIPEAAKPRIYERVRRIVTAHSTGAAVVSVIALAFMVNLVELLCTAGLPAVYTHVLTQHDLSLPLHYGYMALYLVFYMIDDALMLLVATLTLSRSRLQQRGARVLKFVSGAVMLGLGLALAFRPELLMW